MELNELFLLTPFAILLKVLIPVFISFRENETIYAGIRAMGVYCIVASFIMDLIMMGGALTLDSDHGWVIALGFLIMSLIPGSLLIYVAIDTWRSEMVK